MDETTGAVREPWLVLAGLFGFIALYYTRQTPWVAISLGLLAATSIYWGLNMRRTGGLSLAAFKLDVVRGRDIVLALVLAPFGWLFFSAYTYMTRGYWLPLGLGAPFAVLVSIVLVAAGEELFFRGYLQNKLSPRYGLWARVLIAVAAMAFYKNLIHMWDGWPLAWHAELFLLGVLHNVLPSAWMEWSGSLAGPLLLHVFWDLLVYAPLGAVPYWVI